MAWKIQKLAIFNSNIYFGQLGKPWWKVKRVFYYDGKPYILECLQADLLERNYNDSLAGHFRVEKTFKLLIYKYFWSKMRTNIEEYI